MRRSGLTAIAAALGVLLGAAPARASNGAMPQTIGTKGPVTIPVFGDGQSMFRMPSSIAWSLDHRIDLDAFLFYSQSTAKNRNNDFESDALTYGGSGGVVFALGRPTSDDDPAWETYSDDKKLTLGFGIYPDIAGGGDPSTYYFDTYPRADGGIDLTTDITYVNFSFVGAYTFTDKIAIGLSFQVILASLKTQTLVGGSSTPLDGSPTVGGGAIPGDPSYADFLSLFASDETSDPSTYFEGDFVGVQFSGTISLSFRPHPTVGVGISYRTQSQGPPLSGDGTVDADRTVEVALGGDPTLTAVFNATLTENQGSEGFESDYDATLQGIHVPRQARLSVMWWPAWLEDKLVLGMEVAWIDWSSALREAELEMKGGSNPDLNQIIGSDDVDSTLKLRWHDQWVVSLYTAVAVNDALTLRFGFNWGRIPVNTREQGGTATAAYTSTHFSFGAGYRIGNWDIMGLAEHAFYDSERSGTNVDSLTGQDSLYGALQWIFHLGVGYRF